MTSPSAPYGPNTIAIRRFLQRLAALAPDERAAAARAYAAAAGSPRFRAADRALGMVVDRAGRTAERDAALGPLLQLVSADEQADDADVALDPVAEPALAAMLALLARDLLPAETVATLYAPFAALIPHAELGEPPR